MKQFTINEFEFKVGNNVTENDKLLDDANQNDIWFHLVNHPSPHGILFVKELVPNSNTIFQCAAYIKEYSKLKNLKNVKIIYTQRKFIKKTKTIGTVIVSKKNIIKV